MNPVELSIYASLFAAICEEMGTALMRSAYSPNIKERRDFSTALFTPGGRMVAQAAHIPVHLGSMGFAVDGIREALEPAEGDMALVNDPYRGGTHLPDITVVAPVHLDGRLAGFVANRAHHADVGGSTPGSMPVARLLEDEGLVIPPTLLMRGGALCRETLDWILANVRTPAEREGDLRAQMAANLVGARRFREAARREGAATLAAAMEEVLAYGERLARATVSAIPDGTYRHEEQLDDDGFGHTDIAIRCAVTVHGDSARIDFEGTEPQVEGNLNAVYPVTFAATAYCFRCLMPADAPSSAGCFAPLEIVAPEGTLLNPRRPAAVTAGNVETSQRIVDTVFGALAKALPDRIPAASAGTMNNVAIGGIDPASGEPFGYYETIAAGMGARPGSRGLDAVQTHMTNTLNTPVESLEVHYPLRVLRYAVRRASGGRGLHRGGDGVVRELQALADCTVSLLTERRLHPPPGARGGSPGKPGRNSLLSGGRREELSPKTTRRLAAGDVLRIETPGGGGWGKR